METNDLKLFGSRLATARKSVGWSQEKLAKACGLTQAMISRYEDGKGDITLSSIKSVAAALGTSPGHLIGEVEGPPPSALSELDILAYIVGRASIHPKRKALLLGLLKNYLEDDRADAVEFILSANNAAIKTLTTTIAAISPGAGLKNSDSKSG